MLGTLVRLRLAVHGERAGAERALGDLLAVEAMGSLARRWGAPAVAPEDLRAALPEGWGALCFLPSKRRTHLLLVERGRTRHVELASKDALAAAARPLQALHAADPTTLVEPAARRRHWRALEDAGTSLGEALLPPEARAVVERWRGLYVAGLDPLGSPPLDLVGEGDARLGWTHAIAHLPTLSALRELAARPAPRAPRAPDAEGASDLALLLALDTPPGLDAGRFPPLALSGAERAALVAGFPPERTRVLAGGALTLERLRAGALAGVPLVHAVAHGAVQPTAERGAWLAVAPSDAAPTGRLRADAIERLAVDGVVLLSACFAGAGEARYGEDFDLHLGGAFLRAGAPAVVLSPYRVELGAAVELVGDLQAALLAGVPTAEALRRARAAQLARRERGEAAYLTPLRVVGAGHRAAFAR